MKQEEMDGMEWTIRQFFPVARMLGETFGSGCEVVIHDLSRPQSSVVCAVNGHVTGRKVGQSFDHLVRQVLLDGNFSDDYLANYYFYTEDGRLIKSSTVILRDPQNQVAGAMCINMDTTVLSAASELLAGLLPGIRDVRKEERRPADMEEEPENIEEIADQLIEKILREKDPAGMKRDEKIDLVRFMEEKGLFLIKGTVDKVAERLGISKVTVYSYLDEIREKKTDKTD